MKHILYILTCTSLFLTFPFALQAQGLPQGYFRIPMDGDIALSATFAECRMNHFHAGLDMRTGGETGRAVYATADGYVSRVSVSPWGGGKILYITHPNGYTSVYMHLSCFVGAIGKAVLAEQYARQSYSIDKRFASGELPVTKGQLVARSGNSGGSAGPHLHFELRETATNRTVNPLLFGLPYRDNIRPVIQGVKVYPVGGQAVDAVQGTTVNVGGPFYIGVYATDAAEGSTPKNGPDRVEVYIDGNLFFKYTTVGFVVDSGRMVNAMLDFPHFARTRQTYIITRGLPGAAGEWVPVRQGNGIVDFNGCTQRSVKVKAYDVKGNCAERRFTVHLDTTLPLPGLIAQLRPNAKYKKPFVMDGSNFRTTVPAYSLYADDHIHTATERYTHYISPVCTVEPTINHLPPQRSITVSIRKTSSANISPQKITIVHIGNGNKLNAYKTTYADGWYTATPREFGRFVLMADVEDPAVKAVNFSDSRPLKSLMLKVKITDNLAGVETINCYLNGKWILGEYDGKTATVSINVDGSLRSGNNELVVEASDGVGNTARKTWTITR